MDAWRTGWNQRAPSDAEFEHLRRRYALLERNAWQVQPWGTALVLALFAVALVTVPHFLISTATLPSGLSMAAILVFAFTIGRLATHRREREHAIDHLHDRLVRRPDRCLCDVCKHVLEIDADGKAPCAMCDVTFHSAGWPLTQVPAFEELEALSDEAYAAVLCERRRVGRVAFWMRIAMIPSALGILSMLSPGSAGAVMMWTLLLAFIVVMCAIDLIRRRILALSVLLCTRPDLWDPLGTHLPISALDGKNDRSTPRLRLVKRAHRELKRLRSEGSSGTYHALAHSRS